LIDQFNYVGYHDVCIYPVCYQFAPYKDPYSHQTKGIKAVFGGFIQANQTGTEYQTNKEDNFTKLNYPFFLTFLKYIFFSIAENLFEVLYVSQNDLRLSQWLKCFEILFNVSRSDIFDDYWRLRKGI